MSLLVRTRRRQSFYLFLMLTTARLRLRLWRESDLPAFAALNSDPRVMQYMLKPLDREESNEQAERINRHFIRHGFGLWALELPGTAAGIANLNRWPNRRSALPGEPEALCGHCLGDRQHRNCSFSTSSSAISGTRCRNNQK